MSLFVVATPIGNWGDLSDRAKEILLTCDLVIGEEKKETEILLKRAGATSKPYALLNEHSTPTDIATLAEKCRTQRVALVSDCGTPAFCDPGSELVHLARKASAKIASVPGPSSLMSFLSVSGIKIQSFHFEGFLPRETTERTARLLQLCKFQIPVVLMDTPYRLKKLLNELVERAPFKQLVLGCDLSCENEIVLTGDAKHVIENLDRDKSEFLLMLLPKSQSTGL